MTTEPGATAKREAKTAPKASRTQPSKEHLQEPVRVSLSPSVSVDSLGDTASLRGEPLDEGDEQSSEGHFAAMKAKVPRQPGESRKAYRTRVMGHLRKKMADEGVLLGTSPNQHPPAAKAVTAKVATAGPKAATAGAGAAAAPADAKVSEKKTRKTVVLKPGPSAKQRLRDRLWGRGRGGGKSGLKGQGKGRGKGKKGKGKGRAKGH